MTTDPERFAPLPDDPIRRTALSECCQMFRHLITVRYYTFTVCCIINAALIALFFSYKTLQGVQNWAIRIAGGVIALVCIGIEWRTSQLTDFYEQEMNSYSKALGLGEMIARARLRYKHVTVVTALAVLIYAVDAVLWIFFAYPPAK